MVDKQRSQQKNSCQPSPWIWIFFYLIITPDVYANFGRFYGSGNFPVTIDRTTKATTLSITIGNGVGPNFAIFKWSNPTIFLSDASVLIFTNLVTQNEIHGAAKVILKTDCLFPSHQELSGVRLCRCISLLLLHLMILFRSRFQKINETNYSQYLHS